MLLFVGLYEGLAGVEDFGDDAKYHSGIAADLPRHLVEFAQEKCMGLVKTRRLAAMQKQQRAKAAMKPPMKGGAGKGVPRQFASVPKSPLKAF